MRFKVGDYVKLIDCSAWDDYEEHEGEVGKIIIVLEKKEVLQHKDTKRVYRFDYDLQWADGDLSFVEDSNLKKATKKDMRERMVDEL